jgi:hypothetical protein
MRLGSSEVFGRSESSQEGGGNDPRASSRYQAKYRACEMRREILMNELLQEKEKTLEKILRKKKSLRAGWHPLHLLLLKPPLAEAHLLEEKRLVEEKIKLLREESELIDTHLQDQRTKITEVSEAQSDNERARDCLISSLRWRVWSPRVATRWRCWRRVSLTSRQRWRSLICSPLKESTDRHYFPLHLAVKL